MTPARVPSDIRPHRRSEAGGLTGHVLMAVGALLVVVSLVLTLGTIGKTTHRTVSTSVASSTSAPTQTAAGFLDDLASAMRTGNVDFMVSALNPAVIARYGESSCRAAVATYTDPTAAFSVQSTSPPADYSYRAAGRASVIPDTITAKVTFTHDGQPVPVVVHLSQTKNGKLSWFTDCVGPKQ